MLLLLTKLCQRCCLLSNGIPGLAKPVSEPGAGQVCGSWKQCTVAVGSV